MFIVLSSEGLTLLPQPASFAPVPTLTSFTLSLWSSFLARRLGSVFLLFKNAKCFSNIWIKKGSISFINS